MAAGDITFFDQFLVDEGLGVHNLETDELKLAFIDTVTPTTTTADPHFGGTGTTNLQTNELSGGDVAVGGYVIANNTFVLTAGLAELDGDNVAVAANGANPTTVAHGIIYNNTDANKRCIAFLEFTDPTDLTPGYTINWNANGIGRKNQG